MKKKLVSSSKRKWVVNGVLAFGAIALLTTGFATWIIGVQNANDDVSANVTVETATNESVELIATLGESAIKLAETTEVSTGVVKEDNPTGDLEITFSSITLKYGDNWLEEGHEVKNLTIKFATQEDLGEEGSIGQNASNNVTDTADLINKRDLGDAQNYTYIDLDADFTGFNASAASSTKEGNLNVLTWTGVKYTFSWGTFFGGKSPATYYNETFKAGASSTDAANIESELKAMHDAFMTGENHDTAGTIVLYLGVNTGATIGA